MKKIMDMQTSFKVKDQLLLDRLDHLLPTLMRETGIDMWLVMGDEYNEGPCLKTLLPSTFIHARRQSIIIFYDTGDTIERMIVSKPDFTIEQFYTPVLLKPPHFDFEIFYATFASQYDLDHIRALPVEDTYDCIKRIISEKKPKKIGLNISALSPFADGLSHTNYEELKRYLPNDKIVSSEILTIRWLETRTELEMKYMKMIVDKTRAIIKKCYSRDVIQPGVTTIGEARFFLMETATSIGMIPWFDATVWVRRKGDPHLENDGVIILEGDLLHCDFGVKYLGLCSDIQEMAYVNDGNELLLQEYNSLHKTCQSFQDIVAAQFKEGLTGNEILKAALEEAKGIPGKRLFTHPIGFYGHGPGPIIGQFSNQLHVKGLGDYPLFNHTCYALELCIRQYVPSLDMHILYGQEIDIYFNKAVHFFSGRQETLHVF